MYDNLARRAIAAALAQDWQEALRINSAILTTNPDDTDALNRAARASLQLGDVKSAVSFSQKVLEIDPLNSIAAKCVARCSFFESAGDAGRVIENYSHSADHTFMEIPGRTKIVSLINICEPAIIARLDAGALVLMQPRQHRVAITTTDTTYIGRLPDDIAMRIIYLVRNGNEYTTRIKSLTDNEVKVFIKETKRHSSIEHIPSFPFKKTH